MFDVVNFTPASDLANAGTITVGYPTGRGKGSYSLLNKDHQLVAGGNLYLAPASFTLTFNANASGITLTNNTGRTIAAGTSCRLQIERRGERDGRETTTPRDPNKVQFGTLAFIDLGSPNAASANAVALSQAVGAAASFVLNGALVVGGVAIFDVPRNVVAAWTTTSILTITGTDENGRTITEVSASGTSHAGKKAFKTITSITSSASITGATVGTGDVLGLPIFLPSTALILKELEDGAAATAGTAVAGVVSKATNATGDVRGTYDPNSACDGSKGFVLVVAVTDAQDLGVTQA